MIRLTVDKLKEIAENLDCGNKCYINKETGVIIYTPDFDHGNADEELWDDDINELEENWDKHVEIDKMESRESFEIMVDFSKNVDSRELRDSLNSALNRKHPFQNFKWVVDNSGPYRQKWFDFKSKKLIEWVENKLDEINSLEEFK